MTKKCLYFLYVEEVLIMCFHLQMVVGAMCSDKICYGNSSVEVYYGHKSLCWNLTECDAKDCSFYLHSRHVSIMRSFDIFFCVSLMKVLRRQPSWCWFESPWLLWHHYSDKQRILMHRHQGWNVRHGLCHIDMRYLYMYELFIAFVCFVVCSLL